VVEDVQIFKDNGGGCLVENTSHGIGRNVAFMVEVSKATGVHIIAGTGTSYFLYFTLHFIIFTFYFIVILGFYVKEAHSESLLNSSVEELAKIIRGDLVNGCQELPEVKCGVIAEVGSGWPISGKLI